MRLSGIEPEDRAGPGPELNPCGLSAKACAFSSPCGVASATCAVALSFVLCSVAEASCGAALSWVGLMDIYKAALSVVTHAVDAAAFTA